jgi:hypothetical protein
VLTDRLRPINMSEGKGTGSSANGGEVPNVAQVLAVMSALAPAITLMSLFA